MVLITIPPRELGGSVFSEQIETDENLHVFLTAALSLPYGEAGGVTLHVNGGEDIRAIAEEVVGLSVRTSGVVPPTVRGRPATDVELDADVAEALSADEEVEGEDDEDAELENDDDVNPPAVTTGGETRPARPARISIPEGLSSDAARERARVDISREFARVTGRTSDMSVLRRAHIGDDGQEEAGISFSYIQDDPSRILRLNEMFTDPANIEWFRQALLQIPEGTPIYLGGRYLGRRQAGTAIIRPIVQHVSRSLERLQAEAQERRTRDLARLGDATILETQPAFSALGW
jgi:hypothetical protein